jgi:hypothetical protein
MTPRLQTLSMAILLAGTPAQSLLELERAPRREGMPPGWRIQPVKGQSAPAFRIREEHGRMALRISGAGAAAWAHRRLESPITGGGTLSWSWRVLEQPAGADIRSRKTDDAALRVYVVFGGKGRRVEDADRAIFYTWANTEPQGLALPSFVSGSIQVVRVAGASEADGDWREQEADPFADYRRFWPGEAPAITAVGLMQDTDATRGRAVGELRWLKWVPARR